MATAAVLSSGRSWSAPAWMTVTGRGSTVRGHAPRGADKLLIKPETSGPGRCWQIEGHVQRKARLQAASILEGRLSLPAPACPVSPDGAPHTLTVFSFDPRCQGLWGRRSRPGCR